MFYTSGRTSNEAAFLYQLLVRSFGTNNLPDCSNMCHESSGTALIDSIGGVGKGSVTVDDIEHADVIVIAGQNPGTNHPRMLYVLEKAKSQRRQDHRRQSAPPRGGPHPFQGSAEGPRGGGRAWCADRRRVRPDSPGR